MQNLLRFSLMLILALTLNACGGGADSQDSGSEENSESEENTENQEGSSNDADEDAENAQASTSEDSDLPQEAISYEKLQEYLPKNPAGYEASEDPRGESINMQGLSFSQAEQSYSKGDSELEITLADYKQAAPIFTQLTATWASGISIDTSEEKAGTTSISGGKYKGWEVYHKQDKEAELILGISDRFYIVLRGTNMESTEELKEIAESMPLSSIGK